MTKQKSFQHQISWEHLPKMRVDNPEKEAQFCTVTYEHFSTAHKRHITIKNIAFSPLQLRYLLFNPRMAAQILEQAKEHLEKSESIHA